MITAVRLWWAARRPWTCTLPDSAGFPCGSRGFGAATQQQHNTAHRQAAT